MPTERLRVSTVTPNRFRLFERQAQAFATAFQLFRVGVGQQQDELLAAVTGQDVAIA